MVTLDGAPWFVAKEVCDVLGLQGYASKHTARLKKEEVRIIRRGTAQRSLPFEMSDFLFCEEKQTPSVSIISESGLYGLVQQSRKPEARKFNLWVRVVTLEGAPWFVAKEVCEVLGLEGRASIHTKRLEAHETLIVARRSALATKHFESARSLFVKGSQVSSITLISESGLYGLVQQSRKPEARKFNLWVREVVLPAIRRDGGYIMGEEKVATGEMTEDELLAKALALTHVKLKKAEETLDDTLRRLSGVKNIAAGMIEERCS